jgi:hypothetical protein
MLVGIHVEASRGAVWASPARVVADCVLFRAVIHTMLIASQGCLRSSCDRSTRARISKNLPCCSMCVLVSCLGLFRRRWSRENTALNTCTPPQPFYARHSTVTPFDIRKICSAPAHRPWIFEDDALVQSAVYVFLRLTSDLHISGALALRDRMVRCGDVLPLYYPRSEGRRRDARA